MGLEKNESKVYANIIADGSIRIQTDKNDPEAVLREYEVDGVKGEKYELKYSSLAGLIKKIVFQDGKFGVQLQVTSQDDEEYVLSMPVGSNFASGLLKKLPNVDLNVEVKVKPYAFTDKETGKAKKGITVYQGDDGENKVDSFFFDGKKTTNGFPELPAKKEYSEWTSDDWKVYFIGVTKFLRQYTEENVISKLAIADDEMPLPDMANEA